MDESHLLSRDSACVHDRQHDSSLSVVKQCISSIIRYRSVTHTVHVSRYKASFPLFTQTSPHLFTMKSTNKKVIVRTYEGCKLCSHVSGHTKPRESKKCNWLIEAVRSQRERAHKHKGGEKVAKLVQQNGKTAVATHYDSQQHPPPSPQTPAPLKPAV